MARRKKRNRRDGGGGGTQYQAPTMPGAEVYAGGGSQGGGGGPQLTEKQQARLDYLASQGRKPKGKLARLANQAGGQGGQSFDLNTPSGIVGGQYQTNVNLAQLENLLNRPNEQNPYGSRTYNVDPQTGRLTISDQLSESEQGALEDQNRSRSMIGGFINDVQLPQLETALGQGLNFNDINVQKLPGVNDFAGERQRIEGDLFNRSMDRLNPVFEQREERLNRTLANRGMPLDPGASEQTRNALRSEYTGQNDLINQAYTGASQFAAAEQGRLFNQALGARQQGINEAITQRQMPLQELGGLMSLRGGVNSPTFSPFTQIGADPVDVGGIGLGFANIGNQRFMQDRDIRSRERLAQMQNAALGGGGGGAGLTDEQRLRLQAQLQRENLAFQAGLGGL